ncbi:hypothetical protein ACWV26_06630 [Rummeliibacillus sp. JY-2-4R]
MGAYTFRRARERFVAKMKESTDYSFEQLNELKVPQIKEILKAKEIDFKSGDIKKELIAYLVEVPEEAQEEKGEEPQQPVDGDDNVESD